MTPEDKGVLEVPASSCGALTLIWHSRSEEHTQEFGRVLTRHLAGGDLVGLEGDLGSGKTCFVRGIAEACAIPASRVHSPTFTLINEYSGGHLPLYHIDLYRLEPSNIDRIALREYLYGDGVCVVEWFERLGEQPPHLAVHFTFVAEWERRLVAVARGRRYDDILRAVADDLRS
jgi:tRNA threonylcarbamoyladenosine biosynthesis protein TsaE